MPKLRSRKTAVLQDAIARASSAGGTGESPLRKPRAKVGRIMYLECKAGGLSGIARIGRVRLGSRFGARGSVTDRSLRCLNWHENQFQVGKSIHSD